MYLVAGLGNPGREHARNRHNAGWLVVDELARRHGGSWRGKFAGQMAEVRVGEERLALLKPETYMNESGRSVGPAAAFFKLEPAEVLVVHDEGDFDLGRLELKVGVGSPATTASARSRVTSARRSSFACASAWGAPSAAIHGRSPTSCLRTSSRTTMRKS